MRTLITGAVVVSEGVAHKADLMIENDCIAEISDHISVPYDNKIDATDF